MPGKDSAMYADPQEVEKGILRADISFKDSQNLYNKWAEVGGYEDIHGAKRAIYAGPAMLGETMKTLFSDKENVRILDAGAGTGLTAEQLYKQGYRNMDGLEPVKKFTETLKERGYHKRVLHQAVGVDDPVDAPDNTYDAVVVSGSFGPGAIPPSAFHEFIRVVKKGGYIVNCMREEFLWTVPQYKDILEPLLKDLQKQGLIEQIEWTVYPGHFNDKTGVRMIYRVLV